MFAWQIWLIIAGICLIIEMATVGFLIFWLSVAALITCFISLFIPNVIVQTAIFVIFSTILIFFTRPFCNKFTKKDTSVTNANSIIGKEGIVKKEISQTSNGQVSVNGELWTAICDPIFQEPIKVGSTVKVLKIDGVKLVVTPINIPEVITK